MEKDKHAYLRSHWTSLWEALRSTPYNRLSQAEILKKVASLEEISQEIGGSLSLEFKQLSADIQRFLTGAMSLSEANQMMEHALRVEQDTREL